MAISSTRPKDSDRKVRIHLSFYDRIKFLLFFSITFLVLVWADMAGEEGLGFTTALEQSAYRRWWIFPLFAIEFI
ncbi:MAG: hypothetical protein ACKO8Y_06590, partial [Actinomycetota bacterium]